MSLARPPEAPSVVFERVKTSWVVTHWGLAAAALALLTVLLLPTPSGLPPAGQCMLAILKYGGLKTGGVNFDSKVRRESFEPEDLFHAHIGGMDAFARGLKIAAAIRKDGRLDGFVKQRYGSWDSGVGQRIEQGKESFESLETYMMKKGEAEANTSGRQEFLENLINEFI